MDKYMESKYLKLSESQRSRRREQGKGNFLYVRYADDFVVLCNGTKAEAQDMKEALKTLLEHMGLTLSEEKTKLTHITEGFLFLGYKIIREIGTNGKMVPKVLIPDSAITKNRHKVRRYACPPHLQGLGKGQDHCPQQSHKRMVPILQGNQLPQRSIEQKKIRTLLGHGALARSQVGTKHLTDNKGILRPSTQHL